MRITALLLDAMRYRKAGDSAKRRLTWLRLEIAFVLTNSNAGELTDFQFRLLLVITALAAQAFEDETNPNGTLNLTVSALGWHMRREVTEADLQALEARGFVAIEREAAPSGRQLGAEPAPSGHHVETDVRNGRKREAAGAASAPETKPRARKTKTDFASLGLFELPPEWLAEAVRLGTTDSEARAQFDRFADHWRGNGETKVEWLATWRNWIRRSPEFGPARGAQLPAPKREPVQLSPDMERIRQAKLAEARAKKDNAPEARP